MNPQFMPVQNKQFYSHPPPPNDYGPVDSHMAAQYDGQPGFPAQNGPSPPNMNYGQQAPTPPMPYVPPNSGPGYYAAPPPNPGGAAPPFPANPYLNGGSLPVSASIPPRMISPPMGTQAFSQGSAMPNRPPSHHGTMGTAPPPSSVGPRAPTDPARPPPYNPGSLPPTQPISTASNQMPVGMPPSNKMLQSLPSQMSNMSMGAPSRPPVSASSGAPIMSTGTQQGHQTQPQSMSSYGFPPTSMAPPPHSMNSNINQFSGPPSSFGPPASQPGPSPSHMPQHPPQGPPPGQFSGPPPTSSNGQAPNMGHQQQQLQSQSIHGGELYPQQQARPPLPGNDSKQMTGFMPPRGGPPQHPTQPPSGPSHFEAQNGLTPSGPTPQMAQMGQHHQPLPGMEGPVPYMPNIAPPNSYSGVQTNRFPHPPSGPSQPSTNQGFNRMPVQGMPPQGMPPQGMPPMQPMQQPPQHHQPQQQRRLDPEMMPSPIQVMTDDQKSKEGLFMTNEKGQVPPLVTTNFVCQDQGNCNPRFMRSSMYTVPNGPDMMKQTSIPFTITISPFAKLMEGENPPPIVQLGEMGPVRCIRCKAYMCPFMQFIDGGRRFQCSFCRATTEVPQEYFAHLDHTGQRVDKYERPELCLGSFEFIATKDYCKNNVFPLPPAFVFVIDVSYNNIKNGVVRLLCQNMKSILAHLPREHSTEQPQVKVGFITYSSSVHFYNLKSCLAQPQVMIVPDVQDMFMPLLDGFLVDIHESEIIIDSLMEQIPQMYEENRETETILGPAIKAGLEALKAADRSGKLFVFHSSLPIAEAPGKLKNRDDRKLLGTDKEKTILAPQTPFYSQLGQECVTAGCSVDLFTFPNAYIDIATIGQVCRLTGGQIYKYTYFLVDVDGERLVEDVRRSVKSHVAFDAIMRVRTSTGVRPTDFFGNYFMSNTTDVELAAVDSDKAICVEVKHDDKLTDEDAVYIQTAVLYTSVGGQRRLRIHNLSLNTCSQLADLYRNCELDALMNYYSKACLRQLCDQTPKQVKESLINKCAQGLACYRKNCASPSTAGQLILPECMKLYPLYVNCLLKSDAVSGGADMTPDDRSFVMHAMNSMNVNASLVFIYPRLLPLHSLEPGSLTMPKAVRCSADKLKDNGVYLLENGIYMFMWIGQNADGEWLHNVFNVQSAAQIDIDKTQLLDLDNPYSHTVRHVVNQVREERQRFMKLFIVRQRDKLELVLRQFLVEDKGVDSSPSYVDFLCRVHQEIRNLLS